MMPVELFKLIPSIDSMLETEQVKNALTRYPRKLVVESMREIASSWRKRIAAGHADVRGLTGERFIDDALSTAKLKMGGSLRKVINATGVILNTNLGRAPLTLEALLTLTRVSSGHSNLEFDLEKGHRLERSTHVESALCQLTGAKSALVVNNNAAAVLLVLDTFARKKEVIVSRGELIEIGGSFRLPDVLKKSGARLVEVGTTNRTYVSDYAKAITEKTAMLLKSHTSNYRVVGFAHRPEAEELVALARKRRIICAEDIGSGLLIDLSRFGLDEPTVQRSVKAGMDVVTFSGDKLLGGPQCGIIVGKAKWIEALKSNPLMRALRVDKLTLSALSATLAIYLYSDDPLEEIPHLHMIAEPAGDVKRRAQRVKGLLNARTEFEVNLVPSSAAVGGGSCPGLKISSWALKIRSREHSAQGLAAVLRAQNPPVIATVSEDAVDLDMRTVLPEDTKALVNVLKSIMA